MTNGFKNFVEIRGLDKLNKLEKIARVKCGICGSYMSNDTECRRCLDMEKKLNANKA